MNDETEDMNCILDGIAYESVIGTINWSYRYNDGLLEIRNDKRELSFYFPAYVESTRKQEVVERLINMFQVGHSIGVVDEYDRWCVIPDNKTPAALNTTDPTDFD